MWDEAAYQESIKCGSAVQKAIQGERARIRREQAAVIAEMRSDPSMHVHLLLDRLEEATRDAE